MVSGMPCATAEPVPKLDRMSPRTMPLWDRMLGPFEPSPGYGPAVSSGMRPDAAAEVPVVGADGDVDGERDEEQPATAARPAPANRPSSRRRSSNVDRS